MRKLIIDLRSSFWFIPALVVIAAAALAIAAVELDGMLGGEALAHYPSSYTASRVRLRPWYRRRTERNSP